VGIFDFGFSLFDCGFGQRPVTGGGIAGSSANRH